jgi:hypothetical protein
MARDLEITITAEGDVQCLAPDDLDLRDVGRLHVRRASHVEFDDAQQVWLVTLPNGTELGTYATRGEGLAAEVEYLNQRIDDGTIEGVF